jgi:glucuronate isomerase
MGTFIHDDFLLTTPTARRLYHEVAASLPIIDYHSHLSSADLAEDHRFENLAALWINSDPYKHRAMRIAGVPEEQITGSASDRDKFERWAETVPRTLGNPLFHWTALELKRYFGIDELLTPDSAESIWLAANDQLQAESHSARQLLARANVDCVCTSDCLLDELSAHETLAASAYSVDVIPSLRGDDILALDPDWCRRLTGADRTFDAFAAAVRQRLDAFGRLGCKLADHALDSFRYASVGDDELAKLYERHAVGEALPPFETLQLRSGLLRWLGTEYASRGWILQLHIGAQRRTSSRLRTLAGPAGGYASIGTGLDVPSLATLLDDMERCERLPRIILFNLNPADNAALATLTGSFAEDGVPGKVQFGPAWWYNDHALGIRQHFDFAASHSLLSTFIGMTTDSRSLLSFPRHEYFRRLFCAYVGDKVASGEMPEGEMLNDLVTRVCYGNAKSFLGSKRTTD